MTIKHGGNIYEVAKKYGISEGEIIDFSANINPLGIPNKLKATIISNIEALKNYPDPDYKDLVTAIAKYNNIDEDFVIPGNGATEIIFKIVEAIKPKKSLLLAPTFLEYERALKNVQSDVIYYLLNESNGFNIDKNDLLEKLEDDIDLVVLCNPNNPTGQIIEKDTLVEILIECKNKGISLMIDEAFIEFVDKEEEHSLIRCLADFDNLFIIRALTKFFAIPGLRIGYGLLSNKNIKKRIINKKEPWTINGFAAICGDVLFEDYEYIKKSKEFFRVERENMYSELKKLRGLKVFKPHANYIFFKVLEENIDLKDRLICRKILIRKCDNYVNLSNSFYRVAIKDKESNAELIKAIREVLYED
ncbi:threonine-phosphate decarboxylase CobD [Paramaledivibacter caminithermalis]|uniref:threonine-phosphate decarboxylase n=1 Tax=Paramaledivibacter caminithermalis (strain DSM 15212 / CIP 107654 / DViRD3) TaxID=1121301 RepID=A0A1M6MLL8_PARC5|nr:threonine-phosphate decarboxylase CobD [Paramaledivibacter caminithermalis]SHJ84352.1 L-threonine O-3-phosphate decarboxylase [Paramaledivibacter caminithermalis DSM 15212]